MSCIGTAGHIDHGKSTLVKALTGIDPDRLKEEKERGMTIDLGFAWLKLPSGREASIVDVPGHENFIKNMLAGVGGIDVALCVVAADEGVMPQTREHLAILDLLQVQRGVVALTKVDLVDEEWLELVCEEVRELLQTTTLAGAPIIPVSAYTKQGLPQLLEVLDQLLNAPIVQHHSGRPRLPIDRVFSLTGFGTVVTGTLLDGSFMTTQEVVVLPQGLKTRIRGLQVHKQSVDVAHAGNRVAMNLANLARTSIRRGDVVALPGQLQPSFLFDAYLYLLPQTPHPLHHNTQVDFFCGSQEMSARVRLLNGDVLQPGERAWVQLRLSSPVIAVRKDRFILRIPSPSMTIGGGEIVDVQPRYHRRYQHQVLQRLEQMRQGLPADLVLALLDRLQVSSSSPRMPSTKKFVPGLIGYQVAEIARWCNLSENVTQHVLETLLTEGKVYKTKSLWFAQTVWEMLEAEAIRLVREYHQAYPLRSGLAKEEWRSRLRLSPKVAMEVFSVLQEEGLLEASTHTTTSLRGATIGSGFIRLPGFRPTFSITQQKQIEELMQIFRKAAYTPPSWDEAEAITGEEVLLALIDQGLLVRLANDVLFLRETYDSAIAVFVTYLRTHEKMTVAEARNALGTTRKYIVPLLEYMDASSITRRLGDVRVLRKTEA